MEEISIIVDNVSKSFDLDYKQNSSGLKDAKSKQTKKFPALSGISFSVSKGEMIGIIGLNGSGKTTLLRLIGGIYTPDSGKITVNGTIAPLLQIGLGFHEELNAIENIILYGVLLGFKKSEIKKKIDPILEFSELEQFANMKLKQFSTGMRARLAFTTALQIKSDILLIDEILAVGDIKFNEKSFQEFLNFKNNKKTILYTSHNLGKISELCDRVLLINKGKMIMFGNPQEVIEKYKEITSSENKS